MVHAAEADIISPAVAAEDPNGFLGKVFFVVEDIFACIAVAVERFESGNKRFGRRAVLVAVVDGVKVSAASSFDVFGCFLGSRNVFDFCNQAVADCVLTEIQAVTVLGVILKQGVRPSRTVAVFVDGIGRSCRRAAPNGGTTGCIGNIHSDAEQLGNQSCVRGFGAARAGAGELKQRGLVLAADYGVVRKVFLDGDIGDHVIECRLFFVLRFAGNHFQRVCRADADADAAAHTIHRGNSHCKFVNAFAFALLVNKRCASRCIGRFFFVQSIRTNRCVRADIRALVALCAGRAVPLGNHDRNAAFFVSGSALFEGAVCVIDKCGNRQRVAVHFADRLHDGIDHLDELRGAVFGCRRFSVNCVCPIRRNINLHIRGGACVDCLFVHFNDFFALLHELLGFFFHVANRFVNRQNFCKREERGLQNGVGALAEADISGDVNRVDRIKLNVVLRNITLGFGVELFGKLFFIPLAVD